MALACICPELILLSPPQAISLVEPVEPSFSGPGSQMQKYMKKKQRSKTGEEGCVEELDEGLDSQAKRLRTEQMPSHDWEEHNRIGLEDGVDR